MNDAAMKGWAATLDIALPDALLPGVASLLDSMHASARALAVALDEAEPGDDAESA
ncbi:hypothetical protein [Paraburkholderia caledonica]|uniref:hypothetical protein n=1 Tax=Paraburkholderia caledonica TaxID=134536 RepID=UPI000365DF98|nr:hypothetical protein [Paraburkholderia caledonica]